MARPVPIEALRIRTEHAMTTGRKVETHLRACSRHCKYSLGLCPDALSSVMCTAMMSLPKCVFPMDTFKVTVEGCSRASCVNHLYISVRLCYTEKIKQPNDCSNMFPVVQACSWSTFQSINITLT